MRYFLILLFLFSILLGFSARKENHGKMDTLYLHTQKEVREKIKRNEANRLLLGKPAKSSEVVGEIAKVFEPEGTAVIVKAINCFYSESGLRENARHVNTNGSIDGGVAQLNSVHNLPDEVIFDYKKNIAKAYQVYKSWGNSFNAWYGRGCR